MAKDEYEEIKSGPTFIFDEGEYKELIGTFKSVEEGVGPNNSMLYTIDSKEHGIVNVWGSTILDTRLKTCEAGDEIKIVYLGKKKSEKRKGSEYKDFQVFKKKSTAKKGGDEAVSPDDIPF